LKPVSVPSGPSQPVSTTSTGVLCGGGAVHALGATAPHTPATATATATKRQRTTPDLPEEWCRSFLPTTR
jgi:hypothetical protein